jgi:phospholipase C
VKFIEYNWHLPAMGNGATDAAAGSILSMFNFHGDRNGALFLNPSTGEPEHRH